MLMCVNVFALDGLSMCVYAYVWTNMFVSVCMFVCLWECVINCQNNTEWSNMMLICFVSFFFKSVIIIVSQLEAIISNFSVGQFIYIDIYLDF